MVPRKPQREVNAPEERIESSQSSFTKQFLLKRMSQLREKWGNWHQAEHMPHAGFWDTNFMCFILSTSHNNIHCWCYYTYFIHEEREAQKGKALVSRLRADWWNWGAPTDIPIYFPLPHCFLCSILPNCTNSWMKLRTNCFINNLEVTILTRPWAMGKDGTGTKGCGNAEKGVERFMKQKNTSSHCYL